MARRKNKKNATGVASSNRSKKPNNKIEAASKTEKIISENAQAASINAQPASAKGKISIFTSLSGMFLTLILGVYIGTLLPEALLQMGKNNAVKENNVPHPVMDMPPQQNAGMTSKADNAAAEVQSPQIPNQLSTQLAAMEKAVQADPSAANWISLGNLYFDTSQPQKAIHAYEHSLKINPDNADVLTDMGIMYREIKQPNKALECFKQASSIDSRHMNALYNEGVVLAFDLGDKGDAIKAWKRLISINPDARSPSGIPVAKMIEELQ